MFPHPTERRGGTPSNQLWRLESRSSLTLVKPLELRVEENSGVARLVVSGELDLATAERLEEELKRHERDEPSTLVLDLRELTFMDSTGLRTVIAADARARERGIRLVIVRGPEDVDRVFQVTQMDRHLEMVDEPPANAT